MLSEAKTLPFILKYYNMFILLCEWFIFFFFFLEERGRRPTQTGIPFVRSD